MQPIKVDTMRPVDVPKIRAAAFDAYFDDCIIVFEDNELAQACAHWKRWRYIVHVLRQVPEIWKF